MTEAEEKNLQELGQELAGAMQSAFEPECIARAFRTPGLGDLSFTLQAWIDLSACRSPLLEGRPLESEEQIGDAFRAFGLTLTEETTPDDAAAITGAMRRAINRGFAAILPMKTEQPGESDPLDGFGAWLPLYAALVAQCQYPPAAALAEHVDRAYMLIAGVRRNEGWRVAGTPYALRNLEGAES